MKLLRQNPEGWYCGHWNQSPLQIKYSSGSKIKDEPAHMHNDFAEYYLIIKGELTVQVNSQTITVGKLELLMVDAAEKHKIIKKSKDCEYVIIKEKSYPGNKSL